MALMQQEWIGLSEYVDQTTGAGQWSSLVAKPVCQHNYVNVDFGTSFETQISTQSWVEIRTTPAVSETVVSETGRQWPMIYK